MCEEVQKLLEILKNKKIEVLYIGNKCRNDLHNNFHQSNKISFDNGIEIIVNVTADKIQEIFSNSRAFIENDCKKVIVTFGGVDIKISTASSKVSKSELQSFLDTHRSKCDFTINTVMQDVNGKYIDYNYVYRNKKISAAKDIEGKIIRIIGNGRQKFETEPIRIFSAFRLMSQLSYDIDNQTIKNISSSLTCLDKLSSRLLAKEMNDLILGKNIKATLELMIAMGVANQKINNVVKKEKTIFFKWVSEVPTEQLEKLEKFNNNIKYYNDDLKIEAWSILLESLGEEKARECLESFYPLNQDDIEKVIWIINHNELIDSENMKIDILKAKTQVIETNGQMYYRDIIKRVGRLYSILYGDEYKKKSKNLMDAFCSRPYFIEQLKHQEDDLVKMTKIDTGEWVSQVQNKIIHKIVHSPKMPKNDDYNKIVDETIKDVVNLS